jgi:hypothetical protein
MGRSSFKVVSVRLSPELLRLLDVAIARRYPRAWAGRGGRTRALTDAVRDWIDRVRLEYPDLPLVGSEK